MVELFNTLTSSSEDREGALVENWTADRIEEALSVAGDPMRRDALAAANRFRSELVPRLIRAVERVMSVEPAPDSKGDILWIHALFLLADWAEPTAADQAVRFSSADSEALRRLPDPLVRNFAAELMASLLGNEPSRLLEIARNPSTDVGIRGDAIRALGFLGARKQLERPVLLEHLRTLIRGGVVRNSTPEWTVLVGLVMDAGLRELVPDLEPAFRQGWVNEQFFSWESVQELADSPDDRWPQFVQSGPPWSDIAETTGWLDEDATLSRDFSDPSGFSSSSGRFLDEPPGPFRAPPSVGRNDPCPCGSGRKFKKCCGA